MVLTATAEGEVDQAQRIGEACPRKTYSMVDPDYMDRLEAGQNLCKCAIAHFRQYAFAKRQIEVVKDFLCAGVTGMIASHASTLSVSAMLKDMDGDDVDWATVDTAEEKAREFSVSITTRILDAMQDELCRHARAGWTGFDTICQEETGLDAWTLFKGYEVPKDLLVELQGLLSEDAGGDELDETLAREGFAFWQGVIQCWRNLH